MTLSASQIDALKALAGPGGWLDDAGSLAPHLHEWRDRWQGRTPLLLRPQSTQHTAELVRYCAGQGIAITPQGGNTGLVGGQIPQGEVLLSTARLNRIRALDKANATLTLEAGATLAAARAAAAEAGLALPLSLASEGSATIGGVLSTNAGGMEVLRHGSARALCLGLEAVTARGEVWSALSGLRKDNSGYDLKQLFIGAEGTLGVITAAVLRLVPAPDARQSAWCALPDAKSAIALLSFLRARCGDMVSRFELIPQTGIELALKNVPGNRAPLDAAFPWHVLAELDLFGTPGPVLEEALADALHEGLISDAVLAQSAAQAADFLRLRESLSAAQKGEGAPLKHDISVPVSAVARFIGEASAAARALAPRCRILAFGHVGDGNVHFDILPASPRPEDAFGAAGAQITDAVQACALSLGGSISAEHGIGIMKKRALLAQKSPLEMDMMRAIKAALDPHNIMNPRVLFQD